MLSLARTRRLLFLSILAVTAAGLGLMVLVELTDWDRLEAVTLNERQVSDWESRFSLDPEGSLFEQPLSDLATGLLEDTAIARVDFEYSLPGTLRIKTNRFTLSCFILDRATGRLHGLNRQGRLIPLAASQNDWEHPVLTGVRAGRLFKLCDDIRVGLIVEQLERLADDNPDLYRLIEEIDFSSEAYVMVSISGLPYRLKANADVFYDQLTGFIRFVEKYQSCVDDASEYDLRFDNMIIKSSRRNQHGR
jgi:hypothetical protein